jgi:hypothetical protein
MLWLGGLLAFYLIDWLWFRFFDLSYPEDDLDREPAVDDGLGEPFSEGLFWIAVVGAALAVFITVNAVLLG